MDLFSALQQGDGLAVQAALDLQPELLQAPSPMGVSGVLYALYVGQPKMAQLLAARGAPLSVFEAAALGDTATLQDRLQLDPAAARAFNVDGFHALGLACFFGQETAAAALLDAGADPNVHSQNGLQVTPLHSAAAGNHLEVVQRLLDHGADPTLTQEGDFVPLHSAAQNQNLEMARLLLQHGADPAATSREGKSALEYSPGTPEWVALLQAAR